MRDAVGGIFFTVLSSLYKYNMKQNYLPKIKGTGTGRPVNPDMWVTGPDKIRRNKYYAYLKHRSQCRWRKEDYDLSFEDWERFWPDELFEKRGRSAESLLLTREDMRAGWTAENCFVQSRTDHLKRKKEFIDARS